MSECKYSPNGTSEWHKTTHVILIFGFIVIVVLIERHARESNARLTALETRLEQQEGK